MYDTELVENQLKKQHDTKPLRTKDMLRFITCGSVDDGKSTLIGRLLYEAQLVHEDHLLALGSDSKKFGTTDDTFDFALLVDGLASEREQGITIDVAYRYFSTEKRKFIVADTPGHEQYTRNMATGASTSDLAIVLIDAEKGVLTQTKRHSYIVSMLGVKHVILAINKMDLVDYQETIYQNIYDEYLSCIGELNFSSVQPIPLSALKGDHILERSSNMTWYQGPVLLDYLERVATNVETHLKQPFRMPVQWVNRPNANFRGFSGRIESGTLKVGDRVRCMPGVQESILERIVTYDGDREEAFVGDAVTCTLKDEIDVSRGCILADAKSPCEIGSQFEVNLLWMDEKAMVSGRQYLFKQGTMTTLCTLNKLKYRIDINTMEHLSGKTLQLNEIGQCDISLDRAIAFESYKKNRALGSFILIDRLTHATVAAGLICFVLRRALNLHEQPLIVNREKRGVIKEQRPVVLWFTGLSGSGKSTISNLVESRLNTLSKHTMLLDGDNIRQGLNQDLDFTEAGRAENIRRIAQVAKLMFDAGLITLVSFISPFISEREMAKRLIGEAHFIEIFVDAPLEVVMSRDVKGLYKKAKAGEIKNFTGIGSPYEAPISPDLHLDTSRVSVEDGVEKVLSMLYERAFLKA
ncbi:MAG: sulfate adenylyltransferase subunit CysN [Gammaproteobacteria bacterium]|nr:sulfate adenylyltransferase subunit CysN [Gammaproteobacteria bacterium]